MSVLSVVLAASMVVSAQSDGIASSIKDAALTSRIETAFLFNDHLSPFNINTTTQQGAVRLTGSVNNHIQRELATEIAGSFEGVVEVQNELIVMDATPSRLEKRNWRQVIEDKTVSASVRTRLLYHKEVGGLKLGVRTHNNVVTLSGVVDSDLRKLLVEDVVFQTKGVANVVNNLAVKPESTVDGVQYVGRQMSDEWIEKRVETSILFNRHLSVRKVDVEVSEGVCFLSGIVQTASERELAEDIASNIRGVNIVENRITLVGEELTGDLAPLEPMDDLGAPPPRAIPNEVPGQAPQISSTTLNP